MKKSFYALVLCLLVLFSACSSTDSSSSFDKAPISSTSDLSSSLTESASFSESSLSEVESPSYPIENSDGSSINKVGDLVYQVDSVWGPISSDFSDTCASYGMTLEYSSTQLWIFTKTELNDTPVKGLDEEAAFQLAEDFYLYPEDGEVIERAREYTEYIGCPALVLKLEYPDQTIVTAGEIRQTPVYSMTVILLRG
ncbi:MAG: hypothetical protein Q4G07_02175, partial [Oscillospiraceae bacterium]|nr:hypothetical protein [Oscillospiraceae bacterium]